jgi:hypothetical protein
MSELKRRTTPDQPAPPTPDAPGPPVADRREPYAARLDDPPADGSPTAREVLDRFDPRRANLPELTPGKDHKCAEVATRIADPEAFATAFARGIEHSKVRAVLDQPFQKGLKPGSVEIPLVDLLGPEGHRFCSGRRLREVGNSMDAALDCRSAWVDAYRKGARPDVPAPVSVPIESFEGATVLFAFHANRTRTGYEVLTMYVNPPEDDGGQ